MKSKIIVANWKCNPETASEAAKLFKLSDKKDVIIAPPFIFLSAASLSNAALAAQDVFWSSGPYTGEVSAAALVKLGVKYAIIGHSERRSNFGETDEVVSMKARAALDAGLSVIICIGESAKDREAGGVAAERAVRRAVIGSLSGITPKRSHKVVVAYEPVWAIGTGNADNPVSANERAELIKSIAEGMGLFGVGVLYGGSVSGDNALGFLSQSAIDGLLVGGASVDTGEFPKIISVLNRINGAPLEPAVKPKHAASLKIRSISPASHPERSKRSPRAISKRPPLKKTKKPPIISQSAKGLSLRPASRSFRRPSALPTLPADRQATGGRRGGKTESRKTNSIKKKK